MCRGLGSGTALNLGAKDGIEPRELPHNLVQFEPRNKYDIASYILFDTRRHNKTSSTQVLVTAHPWGETEVYPGVIIPYWVLRERSLPRYNSTVHGSSEF